MPAKMFRQGRHTYFRGSSFATGPPPTVVQAAPLAAPLGALTGAATATATAGGAFLPSDIAGLTRWLDGDDPTRFTYSSGVVVSAWSDKSSGGLAAFSQGIVSAQPARNGSVNGRAAVVFDGVDDYLTNPNGHAQPDTVFLVVKLDVRAAFLIDGNPYDGNARQVITGATTWAMSAVAGLDSGMTSDTSWHVITAKFNSASSSLRLDGVQIAAGAVGAASWGPSPTIGGTAVFGPYCACRLGEVLVYNTSLGATDTANVEAYLTAKWLAFTPSSITGLQAWYDSSDAATFTYSSGTEISQWADKSGGARHFAQATVAQQPSRSGTQNGLAKVLYTPANLDYLDTPSFTLGSTYTIVWAGRLNTAVNVAPLSAVGDNALQIYTGGGTFQVFPLGISYTIDAQDALPNVWTLTAAVAGATATLRRNGVLMHSVGATPSAVTTGLRTAARDLAGFWYGHDHYEITAYNSVLSTTDRNNVENYLKAKWGTP